MPITSFTINGSEVDPLVEGFEIRETEGGVSTLVCEIESVGSPIQRFAVHQPIVVEEDGVKIFAGRINQTRERGFGAPNIYDADTDAPQIVTSITAEDYNGIPERVFVTLDIADGTLLKDALIALVAAGLSGEGISVHPSQANGPALPAMSFVRKRASDVIKAFSDATNYLSRTDYDKQLRMWAAGDLAAPFNIDEDDVPAKWTGDVEVETILGDEYANRVTVFTGLITELNHQETFTGDGVENEFQLGYTLIAHRGFVDVDGVQETLSLEGIGFDLAATWLYSPITNTIRRMEQTTPNPPANGAVITITFDGTFEAEATVEDAGEIAANGLYWHVEGPRTDITDQAGCDALAAEILAQRLQAGEQITGYETRYSAPTLRAGQQQTLTAPARDLSGGFILTDLSVRAETPATSDYAAAGLGLIRKVTAKKRRLGKWQYTYRDWLGNNAAAASSSVQTGTGAVAQLGPAPPDKAVQYNIAGAFGGDAAFTYDEATNSIVCGDLCSITAASPESCQVFGNNCHIADP